MTTPADPHPAPWRVEDNDQASAEWPVEWFLVDANGTPLFGLERMTGAPLPPPRLFALVALAPNLERLREIEWVENPNGGAFCPVCAGCGRTGPEMRGFAAGHTPDCWLGNTIAALDKA